VKLVRSMSIGGGKKKVLLEKGETVDFKNLQGKNFRKFLFGENFVENI